VGLTHAVERTIRRHAMLAGGETVLVAVSGGADSVALLHLLRELAPAWGLTLRVLHVDHDLRPGSARDAEFVRALGARLGVPVDVERVQVGPGSVEAAARAARYGALETWAARLGATRIALGHTADDQAETVLMRALTRGSPRGLIAMGERDGPLVRPLLHVWRDQTAAYCATLELPVLDDPSNRDQRFLRTRVRHELLPALEAVFPGARKRLVTLAERQRRLFDTGVTGP